MKIVISEDELACLAAEAMRAKGFKITNDRVDIKINKNSSGEDSEVTAEAEVDDC